MEQNLNNNIERDLSDGVADISIDDKFDRNGRRLDRTVEGKKIPKRYQDRRKVEIQLRDERLEKTGKAVKKIKKSNKIIDYIWVRLDHKTVVGIRKEKFLTTKYIKMFTSVKIAKKYLSLYNSNPHLRNYSVSDFVMAVKNKKI